MTKAGKSLENHWPNWRYKTQLPDCNQCCGGHKQNGLTREQITAISERERHRLQMTGAGAARPPQERGPLSNLFQIGQDAYQGRCL